MSALLHNWAAGTSRCTLLVDGELPCCIAEVNCFRQLSHAWSYSAVLLLNLRKVKKRVCFPQMCQLALCGERFSAAHVKSSDLLLHLDFLWSAHVLNFAYA